MLGQKLTGNEGEGCLLHSGFNLELLKVAQSAHCIGFVDLDRGELNNPWVLEHGLSRRTIFWFVGQELGNEVFAIVRNVIPGLVIEAERAGANFLHDFLVTLTVEGRHSREKDEGDDAAGPDVTLGIVVLVENFWSNVVGSSKLLVKLLVWIVDEGGAKINDLDLVELLVLLEEDIFWLEISANDMSE